MKLAEYVAEFLAGSRVYGVCGAGAMHLNDAICSHPDITFVPMHHEQAAAFAAEADARVTNKIGVVHVTAGPGVTNAITGVACAWSDSIPMLVIAGQVESRTLKKMSGVRQLGVSEVDGVSLMAPITKCSLIVREPKEIRYILEELVYVATTGRKGPVYVEIPLDVQAAEIDTNELLGFHGKPSLPDDKYLAHQADQVRELLRTAERPVILFGNGVRLADAQKELLDVIHKFKIPCLSSWNGSDLIDSWDDLYIGRPGIIGDRAANFAIQNADLVLAVGTRLSIPQIGHSPELFAPNAKLVVVDIDYAEIRKFTINPHISVLSDAKEFLKLLSGKSKGYPKWLKRCRDWREKYPVILPEYRDKPVNSYVFIEELSKIIDDDAIIVTDVGTAFVGTMQSMPLTGKQRLFHASGIAPMGYGLPAAIGAAFSSNRQVICLCGDGGIMFNLQELQTIAHYTLPISIFVFVNNGYMTIRATQDNHFKRMVVSSPETGVSFPNFVDVANAFGIHSRGIYDHGDIPMLTGPALYTVHMQDDQLLAPRVQSKLVNGKFVPVPIDQMFPFLETA